jgi:hypothetical protein
MSRLNLVLLTLLVCLSAHLGIKKVQCEGATYRLEAIALDSIEMAHAQCTRTMCKVKLAFLQHELNKMVHEELKQLGCEK